MKPLRPIKWTARAKRRFCEHQDYIATDSSREVATAWGLRILKATETLAEFPLAGRIVPEIGRGDIRELIVAEHFRVIYKVRRDACDILSVRHTAFCIRSARSL